MIRDVDTAIVAETSAKERVVCAFREENFCAFDFETTEEEDGALSKLQSMLLNNNDESIDDPFECLDKLVGLFKDRVLESELSKEEVPGIVSSAFFRVTGIKISADEIDISWNINPDKNVKNTPVQERLEYAPQTRRPGERWRLNPSKPAIEINAVLTYIQKLAGYLTVEDRLARWGLVMHIASRVIAFQREYVRRPEEWSRVLCILDIREDDVRTMIGFASSMNPLDPIYNLIPIKVLEVATVFRILFKLSLREFELAYNAR